MDNFLSETKLLDFSHGAIQSLVTGNGWAVLPARKKILTIYNFVRDGIAFGYNIDDAVPASRVLSDGYGQCNTKGTLFMALLRAVGVPCRLHGFTIGKALQKGAMTGLVYKSAPQEIVHSWVEVLFDGAWRNLEGFILDMKYLNALQRKYASFAGGFCGYGVATDDFRNPCVEWDGGDTYIQKEGIVRDFGLFDSPDEFFSKHAQEVSGFKKFLFRHYGRHAMNRNVRRLRNHFQ